MKKKPEEIFKTPPKEDFKTYFNRMVKPYIDQERLNDAIKIAKEHGYSVVTKEK